MTTASPIPSIATGTAAAKPSAPSLPGGIGQAQPNTPPPFMQSTTNVPTTSNGAAVPPTSGIAGLPKPQTTPTAPTGVASSDLATSTVATQQQGTAAMDQSVQQHAANKTMTQANPAVSIVDLLNSKGLPSDYVSRAKMAQVAGIQNYAGTAQQNAQLIGWFNTTGGQPQTDASGGSSQGATGTGTGPTGPTSPATGTSTTTATTDANGNPIVNTGSPGDQYNTQISDNQKAIGENYDDFKAKTDQVINGTFPLTPSQQAVLDNTQKQFDAVTQQQMIANKSYENAVALAGNRLGINIQNPIEYAAEGQKAVNDDLQKINNLDATAALTLANLKQGFLDKDYTYINDQYTALQKTLEDKNTALESLQKRTDDLYTSTRDYNEKVTEFAQSQAQQKEEFEQSQALEKAKFSAQYAGLIDPNTGAFKPTADASQLPGMNSLPSGMGTGAAAHYFDPGQVADKGLATYLAQAAKQAGFGVVDTSQNKTFNQSLSAYSGLQQAIDSGALNPNDTISKDIGQKKPASIITRIFQGTQPGDIATVLGAGGGNIPNLQNMTWRQAASYLQSSIYSAMGTNSTAQKYAMNPAMASSDLQAYHDASPANANSISQLWTSQPDLTPSQIMQILNPQ